MKNRNYAPKVRFWIPEGMCEENALRNDIRDIAGRGFSGAEIVFENLQNLCVPEERQYGSAHFVNMLRAVLDEAKKNHLTVDLANGFQWPVSSGAIKDCNDPAAAAELTYGVTELSDHMETILVIPERKTIHEKGKAQLISVCAYRVIQDHLLDYDSYIDLSDYSDGAVINYPFYTLKGRWAVFCFYAQPTEEKVNGCYYVVNHFSEEGALACAADWNRLFADLGETCTDVIESFFCDSLEYHCAREWTYDFPEYFEKEHGYSIERFLPVIGFEGTYPANELTGYHFDHSEEEKKSNRDYASTLTSMFCRRHLKTLSECAHQLNKTVRYQVAYNKPLREELCAVYADIPENESLNRASLDNLRMMAAAAHLERKPYSYEVSAEFMNAYGQTQRDILWWIKRAWVCGINRQVFHGASYCGSYAGAGNDRGYIPGIAWPGYETFGKMVSNYWNRTLSSESMKNMTGLIGRVNRLMSARHHTDLLFVRDAYINNGKGSDGMHIIRDHHLLNSAGYTYEFISPEMLGHKNCYVRMGRLDPDGAAYKALILMNEYPYSEEVTRQIAKLKKEGLRVYSLTGYSELKQQLEADGIFPDVRMTGDTWVYSSHTSSAEGGTYLLYNGNQAEYDIGKNRFRPETVCPGLDLHNKETKSVVMQFQETEIPVIYDPVSDRSYSIPYSRYDGRTVLTLTFGPDEMKTIRFVRYAEIQDTWPDTAWHKENLTGWTTDLYELTADPDSLLLRDSQYIHRLKTHTEYPVPVPELTGTENDTFAGYAVYQTDFIHDDKNTWLFLEDANDGIEISLNGVHIPAVSEMNLKTDLNPYLKQGDNHLEIKVYTNLNNRLQKKKQIYGIRGSAVLLKKESA